MAEENKLLEQFKSMVGEPTDSALEVILARAESFLLAETNRTVIPEYMNFLVLEIAMYMYSRSVETNETSRSEGGISVTYGEGMPSHILKAINSYRLARVTGHAFE